MDLFCGTELPKQVLDCLDTATDESLEDLKLWGKSREEIVENIKQSVLDELVYMVYQNDICLLFLDKTPYTIYLSIVYTDNLHTTKLVRLLKDTFAMFVDKTDIHKVEIGTTCPDLHPFLLKSGFVQEGQFTDSRRIPTGEFVDEFYYGYIVDAT